MNKEIEELINHEKFIATKPYIRKLGEVINTLEYLRTAIYHEEIDTKKAFEAGQKDKEAQIEKMKCCGNCAKNGHICVAEEMQGKLCGKNKDKWELRR